MLFVNRVVFTASATSIAVDWLKCLRSITHRPAVTAVIHHYNSSDGDVVGDGDGDD